MQQAKKVVSDSPGLEGFAIGLVNSVINLPDGQVKFFEESKLQRNCEINLLIKTFLGLVEMMFGLVNVSFSLPEWQAVKVTFFASWQWPLFLADSPYIDSCLNLYTAATIFCPQGGGRGEFQLYYQAVLYLVSKPQAFEFCLSDQPKYFVFAQRCLLMVEFTYGRWLHVEYGM